jgi:flagellar biosynthesis/type III secretory pathway chaperone
MDGPELAALIEDRYQALQRLHEVSSQQMDAITAGRMSQLMQLLADKQEPLHRLVALTQKIQAAVGEDPASRSWESDHQRQQCRERQEACERIHREIIALDGACEAALQTSRGTLQTQLDRLDSARSAANGYAARDDVSSRGATLDLTNG